ncbi:hypothetical protein VTI74DRAFT_7833 [Chaetomium olivicolor]
MGLVLRLVISCHRTRAAVTNAHFQSHSLSQGLAVTGIDELARPLPRQKVDAKGVVESDPEFPFARRIHGSLTNGTSSPPTCRSSQPCPCFLCGVALDWRVERQFKLSRGS